MKEYKLTFFIFLYTVMYYFITAISGFRNLTVLFMSLGVISTELVLIHIKKKVRS